MRKKVTPELAQEIARLYTDEGLSAAKVGERVGLGQATVWRCLADGGVERRPSTKAGRAFTDEERLDILWRFEEGEAIAKIARAHNAHWRTLTAFLEREVEGFDPRAHRTGPRASRWKGGRVVQNGYVKVWIDPDSPYASMADSGGYVKEHRLVVAESLGRPLESIETVHHVNGDRQDNRLENLQLRQGAHGKGQVMRCLDCGSHNLGHATLM